MRIVAVGQSAEGFIAIGQEATGVIALGQIATGVIAIGQIARGVIAVGQVAFGLASLGMLSFGLVYAIGLGAGGRAGKGIVFPLVPVPSAKPVLPERTTLEAIRTSGREGWLEVVIRRGAGGRAEVIHRGEVLPAQIVPQLLAPALAHTRTGGGHAVALVVPSSSGLAVTRLIASPGPKPFRFALAAVQLVLMAVLAGAYWELVLVDLGEFVFRMLRDFGAGIFR